MMKRSLSAGILAGGKSIRMGEDKRLMVIGGETMLGRLVKELAPLSPVISAPAEGLPKEVLFKAVSEMRFEQRSDDPAHIKESEKQGCLVICDENEGIGPIEGIRRLLETAKTDDVFCCAADMPFLTLQAAEYLADRRSAEYDCWIFTEKGRLHPLCGIYSKKALPAAEKVIREGNYAVRALLDHVRTKYVPIEEISLDPRVLMNINNREEYLALFK